MIRACQWLYIYQEYIGEYLFITIYIDLQCYNLWYHLCKHHDTQIYCRFNIFSSKCGLHPKSKIYSIYLSEVFDPWACCYLLISWLWYTLYTRIIILKLGDFYESYYILYLILIRYSPNWRQLRMHELSPHSIGFVKNLYSSWSI